MLEQKVLSKVAVYLEKHYKPEERRSSIKPMCQAAPAYYDAPEAVSKAAPRIMPPKAAPKAAPRVTSAKAGIFTGLEAEEVPIPQIKRENQAAASRNAAKQLDDMLKHMGESFSQMLMRLIDERGLTDPQVYHKANLDRKLFSKIRKNIYYSPNKRTVIALALALELSVTETEELLKTAGFSLSNSSRADLIIRFSLENQIYDVFQVNEILYHYEEPLLGRM